jgi:hypothetical protein
MSAGYDGETRVLLVDGRLRTSGTSSAFTVTLPESLNVEAYAFISSVIPSSAYNIRTGINDQLVTSLGTATVAAGSYTGAQLATALQTALQLLDATFSVTFSGTSGAAAGKFTIDRVGNFGLPFVTTPSSMRRQLGFGLANLTGAASYISDGIADLAFPVSYYITSQALSGGGGATISAATAPPSGTSCPLGQIVQKITLGGSSFGGKAAWDSSLITREARFTSLGRNVRELDFALYQDDYQAADFGGQEVSFELILRTSRTLR